MITNTVICNKSKSKKCTVVEWMCPHMRPHTEREICSTIIPDNASKCDGHCIPFEIPTKKSTAVIEAEKQFKKYLNI